MRDQDEDQIHEMSSGRRRWGGVFVPWSVAIPALIANAALIAGLATGGDPGVSVGTAQPGSQTTH